MSQKSEDLDRKMRVYEEALDPVFLPGVYLVARLDGRSFSRLTRSENHFQPPFDERFRDCMLAACHRLLQAGFAVEYAYTQSDEISLLFRRDEAAFGRKLRKYLSLLAGEASVGFTLAQGITGIFDCRVAQLPRETHVIDYFRWRQEDAHRNALNAHCYWLLRRKGMDDQTATEQLTGLSVTARNELLLQHHINFNELPTWQRRGIGLFYLTHNTEGVDPRTQTTTTVQRRKLHTEFELPAKDEYSAFLQQFLSPTLKVE